MTPPSAEGRLLQFGSTVREVLSAMDDETRDVVMDALRAIRDNPAKPDGIDVVLDKLAGPDGDAIWVADLPMQHKAVYRVKDLRTHNVDAVNVLSLRSRSI